MQDYEFINGQKVLIGISAGINSAAVLCWLKESGLKPSELHLFYAHFEEHSPDSFPFVKDQIKFARKYFENVVVKITRNKVLAFFEKRNMVPHPKFSPCSVELKIKQIDVYAFKNEIYIDLVGYVEHELKRRSGKAKQQPNLFGLDKLYPVGVFTDEWCFEIVDKHIGWHPAIYDIVDENGKRIFKHNNCLPCKNMNTDDLLAVKKYYPDYHDRAMKTCAKIQAHYGMDADEFYTTFGRDLGQENTCTNCKW